jgi:hypothetical protein
MRIEFLAAAREEFLDAARYYDSREPGLGDEFVEEVWEAISRIVRPACLAADLSKNQALSHQEIPLRCDLPGKVQIQFWS